MSYQSTGLPPTGFAEKRRLVKIIGLDELDEQSDWFIPQAGQPGEIAIGFNVYDGDLGVSFQACAITCRTDQIDDKNRKVIGPPGPYLPPGHKHREFSKSRKGYIDKRTGNLIRDVMEITGYAEGVDQPVYFTLFGSQVQEIGAPIIRKLRRILVADASGKKDTAPIWLSRLRVTTVHEVEDNGEWWRFAFEIEAKPGETGAPSGEEIELGERLAESVLADARSKGWLIDEPPASAPTPTSSRAPTSVSSRPANLMTVQSGKQVWDEPPPRANQPPPPTSEADYGADDCGATDYGANARDGWPQ